MSGSTKPPVATLAGVSLPGGHRAVPAAALPEHVSVLRPAADGGWTSVSPSPGMAIHAGDIIRLRGAAFAPLGARAFTVGSSAFADARVEPPNALQLHAHEATHIMQQRPSVTPVNEAWADAIECRAVKTK